MFCLVFVVSDIIVTRNYSVEYSNRSISNNYNHRSFELVFRLIDSMNEISYWDSMFEYFQRDSKNLHLVSMMIWDHSLRWMIPPYPYRYHVYITNTMYLHRQSKWQLLLDLKMILISKKSPKKRKTLAYPHGKDCWKITMKW
mgnify:CR=1 FL=1